MVKTEPFIQWVIEDKFCGPRPDFSAGVRLTQAVAPWEEAKLRLLNGAHSGIAYLGGLAAIDHVHEVLALPEARAFVEALWDEAETTLTPPPELDVAAYRRDLMARFDNPTLRHRTRQIAMDGSQKLPQRLLGTIRDRLQAGQPITRLALGVAAWMRYVTGVAEDGSEIDVRDPHALKMMAISADAGDDPVALFEGLSSLSEAFGTDLAGNAVFRDTVVGHLEGLFDEGAKATVAKVAG